MIQRKLYQAIKDHLDKQEMALIIGPRQVGKTTLMMKLQDELKNQGQRTLFLNLDVEEDRQYFGSQRQLIDKVKLELGEANGGIVFIDEIQRKENAGLFLKGIYDMNLPYKFIFSGSGSVELKEKVHESLAGRKKVFELTPVTFEEFVNFKTGYKYQDRLEHFFEIEKVAQQSLLENYLQFGGYPKVITSETSEEKGVVIDELYRSYLERDIALLLGVEKEESFTSLLRLTASQVGSMVNYSELASTLALSSLTIKKYLWYLEKTFILDKVTPFFKNPRKEITKSPIFYFNDLGLRNYISGRFGAFNQNEAGFVFQNMIYLMAREKLANSPGRIHFWRSKDRAEVDIVVDANKLVPVEVKYRQLKDTKITRSLQSFITRYKPQKVFVVHLGCEMTRQIEETTLIFTPYYKFLTVDIL